MKIISSWGYRKEIVLIFLIQIIILRDEEHRSKLQEHQEIFIRKSLLEETCLELARNVQWLASFVTIRTLITHRFLNCMYCFISEESVFEVSFFATEGVNKQKAEVIKRSLISLLRYTNKNCCSFFPSRNMMGNLQSFSQWEC